MGVDFVLARLNLGRLDSTSNFGNDGWGGSATFATLTVVIAVLSNEDFGHQNDDY